jgi:transcriptional regulator with XRE-family HTH domain
MAADTQKHDPFDVIVGARVRARRLQLKIGQAELGKALGVSYQQVQKYESGANRLSGKALTKACRLLQLRPEQLLGDNDASTPLSPPLYNEDLECDALLKNVQRINAGPLRGHIGPLVESLARLSDMHAAQAALAAQADLLGALPFAIYTTDADGLVTYYNDEAVAFSGRRPRLMSDRWCVTWRLYTADGRRLPHEDCPMAIALKENRVIRGVRAIAETPAGERRWFAPHPTPLHNANGALIGGINLLLSLGSA